MSKIKLNKKIAILTAIDKMASIIYIKSSTFALKPENRCVS